MKIKNGFCITIAFFIFQSALCNIFHVSTTGSDTSGDGSEGNPWRTVKFAAAKVPANQGHTIRISAGTFAEMGPVEIPPGVNVEGAGKTLTILKGVSSFFYHPESPGYATDKFLISLTSANQVNGNQSLKNFSIDGDSKQLHGGIYVRYRSSVIIESVKVHNTNFTGIWLWDVKDSKVTNTELLNCSWGSTGYCVGALNLGNIENVEIDQLQVDESVGYGIKAIGPSGYNDIFNLKIHDSRISVHPYGLWNNGSAPNIAIELWQVNLVGCEIYNTYVDNTISLVNSNANPSTGIQTIRVHHNTIDMETRAKGAGYGVELTVHDAEVDHNYFIKGRYGIANWDNPMKNWEIHHNVFYALEGVYPGDIVRVQWSGLHYVNFYNNTIEFKGDKTMNVIGVYGGTSEQVNIINNLLINNNTAYSYYPNSLVHMENGAVMNNLSVRNNFFDDLPIGTVPGTYSGSLTGDPKITASGSRPDPYYTPASGSPLIDSGLDVVGSLLGLTPDIGAFEYTSSLLNLKPSADLTSPADNSSVVEGSTVMITATASDADGSVSKVEFFQGATKLGEDFNSPYAFEWSNVTAGSYLLSAKATDNKGATTSSGSVTITVAKGNTGPSVSITSPTNDANFTTGATINIAANASDTDGTINKVEFFRGTTRLGEDLTSPYSYDWNNVGAGSYSLTARATDDQGAVTSSTAVTVTVTDPNQVPVVRVTSPENHAAFLTGSTVTIDAIASDADGTINKVEFFRGTAKLGEDLTSPYSYDWINVAAGSYSITAKATDDEGTTATSVAISMTVTDQNQEPVVSITSPENHATFSAGSTVTIEATASDSDGTVSKVEFFQGTTKLGEDLTSPYSYDWINVAAEGYSLTARATDDEGLVSVSSAINITISDGEEFTKLGLFAPDAELSGNMKLTSDPTASKGSYFSVPAGAGKNYAIPPSAKAEFNFTLEETDTYVAWVRIKSPASDNQGYYLYDGKGNWTAWLAGVHTEWTWVKAMNAYTNEVATFPFTAGSNVFRMAWFHDNVQVDRVLITNDLNYIPEEPAEPEVIDASFKLGLYATDATLTGDMKLYGDLSTSKGSYFSMPSNYGKNYYIPVSSHAQFHFQIDKADDYLAWVRIKSPTVNNQGFHLYDGKGNWTTWLAGVHTEWTWVRVTNAYTKAVAVFPYSEGINILRMAWFHDNVQVDAVFITNDHTLVPSDKASLTFARMDMPTKSILDEGETSPGMAVFPNPVKDKFTLTYTSDSAQEARVTIKSGTTLASTEMSVSLVRGRNSIDVDMADAQKGLYLISIHTADGNRFLQKVMVIK